MEALLQQVVLLQEMVRRLNNSEEAEKQSDSTFQEQSVMGPWPTVKNFPTSRHKREEGSNAEEQKLAISRRLRRKIVPLKPGMPS